MENSFWNHSPSAIFVDSFTKSFTLYVESGIGKKAEAEVNVLLYKQRGRSVSHEFKTKLHKIIVDHRLPHPEDQAAVSSLKPA